MQFYISPRQFIQNTMVCFVLFLYLLPSFVNFTHTNIFLFSFLNWKSVYVVYMYIKRAVALSNLVKLCVFRNFSNESKKKRTKNFKSEPVELNVWVHVQAYQQRANSVYRALKKKEKTSKRYTLRVIFSMYVQIPTKMGLTHKYPQKTTHYGDEPKRWNLMLAARWIRVLGRRQKNVPNTTPAQHKHP